MDEKAHLKRELQCTRRLSIFSILLATVSCTAFVALLVNNGACLAPRNQYSAATDSSRRPPSSEMSLWSDEKSNFKLTLPKTVSFLLVEVAQTTDNVNFLEQGRNLYARHTCASKGRVSGENHRFFSLPRLLAVMSPVVQVFGRARDVSVSWLIMGSPLTGELCSVRTRLDRRARLNGIPTRSVSLQQGAAC